MSLESLSSSLTLSVRKLWLDKVKATISHYCGFAVLIELSTTFYLSTWHKLHEVLRCSLHGCG